MVSDFVREYNGLLELTNEELRQESDSNHSIRKCAREILKFGSGNEGYWNSEKFLKQMERAVAIADVKYTHQIALANYGSLTKVAATVHSEMTH